MFPAGFESFGKTLMFFGIILLITGAIMYFGLGKWLNIGKLPGDIHWEKGNFSFYFPVVTSIAISIILTIVLNIFNRR